MEQVVSSLVPLIILRLAYQVLLIKMPIRRLLRVGIGFIYLFVGLTSSLSVSTAVSSPWGSKSVTPWAATAPPSS